MAKITGKEDSGKAACGTHGQIDSCADFKEEFQAFAKFGDRESDGQTITLKNIDKWLQQSGLLGGKSKITNADTAITFSKIAKTNKRISFEEFRAFLEQLAQDKGMEAKDLTERIVAAGQPGLSNVTTAVASGAAGANLERMTDTSQYTGSHKERFDETGKGRGKEGREDVTEVTGYVQGYKEKDTYDEKAKKKES